MNWNDIFALGGFVIAVLTVVGTAWWRISVMIKEARSETSAAASAAAALAALARQELAEHRLHSAETYVTRSGLRDVTDQIMEAIGGVKDSVDQMRLRIDRAFDKPPSPRPARG